MLPPLVVEHAERVVHEYAKRKKKIVTAESCTGGLLISALTEIPGSSAVVDRGFITYSNDAKLEVLGVMPDLIDSFDAVSAEIAEAMAVGALEFSGADVSIAVTGIAGPTGGTLAKPIGLVFLGLATRDGTILHVRAQFKGTRDDVRTQTVMEALRLLMSLTDKG